MTSCSDEARAFIAAGLDAPPRHVTRDNLAATRAETAAEFAPRIERALDRYPVEVREITLGGIDCLEIIPRADRKPGTILYCYGGGYIMGSPREDLIVSAALAAHAGARVVAPWYRLAPEHPYPAAIDDCTAVHAVVAGDPSCGPLALAGESAGGNAALCLLRRSMEAGAAMPVAVALLSPWSDLKHEGDSQRTNDGRDPTPWSDLKHEGDSQRTNDGRDPTPWSDLKHEGDSQRTNDGRDPTLTLELTRQAALLYSGGRDLAHPGLSPLRGTWNEPLPPVMITTGTRDVLLDQNLTLATVLENAGADVTLRVWDELWHVFEFYDELPEADRSLRDIAAFLRRHLDGG